MSIKLDIENIRTDGGTQSRVALDQGVVQDYAEAMSLGEPFPAIDVYFDGTHYWLADGFHRVAAMRQSGRALIDANVHQGTQRDAILHSVGANRSHGLRRSNADKRTAVEKLLRDEEWGQWSDRQVADKTGVHHSTVGTIRRELESTGGIRQSDTRQAGDGRVINTANIGTNQPTAQPAPKPANVLSAQELLDAFAAPSSQPTVIIAADELVEVSATPASAPSRLGMYAAPAQAPTRLDMASAAPAPAPTKLNMQPASQTTPTATPAPLKLEMGQPAPAAPTPADLVTIQILPGEEGNRRVMVAIGAVGQMPAVMRSGSLGGLFNLLERELTSYLGYEL